MSNNNCSKCKAIDKLVKSYFISVGTIEPEDRGRFAHKVLRNIKDLNNRELVKDNTSFKKELKKIGLQCALEEIIEIVRENLQKDDNDYLKSLIDNLEKTHEDYLNRYKNKRKEV